MSTHTYTLTQTRTEVYVGAKVAYAFQAILSELGLGDQARRQNWDSVEHAMHVWLGEQTLDGVVLEIYDDRTDELIATFDVAIAYTGGQATMRHDAELARLAARKVAAKSAAPLRFRVVMDTKPWRTDVTGWTSTTWGDATGLRRRTIGELARGPGITSELSFRV